MGAGVQSTTIGEMSLMGILPWSDHMIFADTGYESPATYKHLLWLESRLGRPIHRVSKGNIKLDYAQNDGRRVASMPFFTGNGGMTRRQCTREYKVDIIQKKIRELVGLKPYQRAKGIEVELWFGISMDEARRIRMSDKPWIVNRYPLIEDLAKPYTRTDCLRWMEDYGFPEPPRSSCIACP